MNTPVTSPATGDFKRAVALQFASRPTLRQLAAQKVLQFFVERHANLATVHPPLNDAEPLLLMVPTAKYTFRRVSLMDRVMQALLEGKPLSLETVDDQRYGLTFPDPYRFQGSDGFEYTELQDTSQAFNELLQALPYYFQQAQLEYWQGPSSFGVSRDRWLQQTLKSALLQNLPLHDLDARQQACVYGLLKGGQQRPGVFVVEVQLEAEGQRYTHMLPNLLLHGEWDERTVVLWCSPSSVVKGFASFDAFA
ncbi:MAG: hypothetical protein RSE94_16105 [Pseudomonas sp.]